MNYEYDDVCKDTKYNGQANIALIKQQTCSLRAQVLSNLNKIYVKLWLHTILSNNVCLFEFISQK